MYLSAWESDMSRFLADYVPGTIQCFALRPLHSHQLLLGRPNHIVQGEVQL